MPCASCGKVSADAATQMAQPSITKEEAKATLDRMKRSLKGWLKYRRINDEVLAGKRSTKIPQAVAIQRLREGRDWAGEQKLANELYMLLSEVHDSKVLPKPNLKSDPGAAVKLANIVITGKLPTGVSAPIEQGILPLLVVPAGLIYFMFAKKVNSDADVQKEKERMECIKAGACTDYGFWLKWGVLGLAGVLVYVNRDAIMKKLKVGK